VLAKGIAIKDLATEYRPTMYLWQALEMADANAELDLEAKTIIVVSVAQTATRPEPAAPVELTMEQCTYSLLVCHFDSGLTSMFSQSE